jgi:hypothetical protein
VLATAKAGRINRERPIAIEVLIAAGSFEGVSLVLSKCFGFGSDVDER